MSAVFRTIHGAIGERIRLWLSVTIGFVVLYYLGMLLALIVRFGKLPNYMTVFDWFGSVARIIRSTPSVQDMIPIILDEWLVEIGFMNTDYGMGISEWSMTIIPVKVLIAFAAGALVATGIVLLLRGRACSAATVHSAGTAVGLGSAMFALSNLTMTWVVCCAAPSWIAGLAMLGMSVATTNILEPFGFWINLGAFTVLAFAVLALAWAQSRKDQKTAQPIAVPVGGMAVGRG
jgi:hypothetical protein